MNAAPDSTPKMDAADRQEELSFLFAQLVLQQSNMAMMLMGKVAHPESGKAIHDIEAARLFIDQLEMVEAKTKGNLSKDEEALLKQTLMSLRLNFVEAVESSTPGKGDKTQSIPPRAEPAAEPLKVATEPPPAAAAEDDDHRKKFTKKY